MMLTRNVKGMEIALNTDTLHITVKAEGKTWETDASFRARAEKAGKTLYFDEAKIEAEKFETGEAAGVRAFLRWPQGESLELRILREEATGYLRFEMIPLSLPGVQKVLWPAPFIAQGEGAYAVLPDLQGMLLPADWPQEAPKLAFNGQMASCAAYMSWYGEMTKEGGYIAIFPQYYDTAYAVTHPAGGPTRVHCEHLSSLGEMTRREVLCAFTGAGSDYVTLCKIYRSYVKRTGLFTTLREKIARLPSVEKLIGASVLHVGTKTHVSPDSAFYNKEDPEKNGSLIPFAVNEKRFNALMDAGAGKIYMHLDGWGQPGYDNQHPDYLPPCKEAGGYPGLKKLMKAVRARGGLFGLHDQYRDYYLDAPTYREDDAVTLSDGKPFEMARWAGGKQNYMCSALSPAYVRRNFEELKKNGIEPDAVYLDVFTCNEPDECFHPEHRCTRRESLSFRKECFDEMLYRGVIPSSEEAADWAMNSLVFCHWAPYAKGGVPVPLFNLVYHDCFLVPWMLGKGEYGTPEGERGFFHALLNGGMGYIDEEHIEESKIVSALNRRVALCEMVSHEILPSGAQRAVYSDGTSVTVDFKAETYSIEPPLQGE